MELQNPWKDSNVLLDYNYVKKQVLLIGIGKQWKWIHLAYYVQHMKIRVYVLRKCKKKKRFPHSIAPTVKARDLLAFITPQIGPDNQPSNSKSESVTGRGPKKDTEELCPKIDELLATTENDEAIS